MTNSETHRQFYLAAAGIRMWYARRPLPGAAPSPEYQLADDEVAVEPVLHNEMDVVRPPDEKPGHNTKPARQRSVDLQALMASPAENGKYRESAQASPRVSKDLSAVPDLPAAEVSNPDSTPAESAASAEPETGYFISAHLGFWASGGYLLVSQWSDEASERLQDALARNLLGALRQSTVGERFMLHWPVFRNRNIPGNSPEDFQEVLSRLLSSYRDRSVILLGVMSDVQEDQRNHCLKALLPLVGTDFPCSLAELSATPSHKRDLWNALKSRYSI